MRIARLLGINIYLDWSLIFIFLLLVWNLGWGVFPSLHPEWGLALDLSVAVFAAVLFFLSILAHEMAHSIVANARGLPVRRITLLIFGGISDIEREPASPLTEFLMAFVGPLTSIVLGLIFLFLGRSGVSSRGINFSNPVQSLAGLSPVDTLLLWLGPINIILGIFNLIPAFPLDGGRVFRSIIWGISHNLHLATRWAAIIGQVIAWVFIGMGIAMIFGISVPYFGTGVISGLWLAFIGWFLNNAAVQSYRQVIVEDILAGVPVSRLMRSSFSSVPPLATIDDLMDHYVLGTDDRAFPVVENNRILGMICIEDIRKVPRSQWNTTTVTTIMTPASQLETISSKEDASEAFNKLARRDVGQIPVIDNGQLVGILRRQDIVRYLQAASNSMSSRTS
jgi:Zn-dependent protease